VRLQAFTKHPWNDILKQDKNSKAKDMAIKSGKFDLLKDGKFSAHLMKTTSSLQPISTALERIENNTKDDGDRISFLDFEVFKAPRLK